MKKITSFIYGLFDESKRGEHALLIVIFAMVGIFAAIQTFRFILQNYF